MEIITSIANPNVSHVKKLIKDTSYRRENKQFVAEGYNIVKDAPAGYISTLYLTESAMNRYSGIENASENIVTVSEKVMTAMSDTKTPSGVLAVCNILRCEDNSIGNSVAILLDNLSDPGNAGTIIRTAVACGVSDILLYGDCTDVYAPKVVRSSMGGIFYINPQVVDIKRIPDNLYVLDMAGENIYNTSVQSRAFTLAVGNEAHGISPEIRERAAKVLSLPMSGRMESLNAGVSLSIALYQLINGGR